jgi:hypothetical protein
MANEKKGKGKSRKGTRSDRYVDVQLVPTVEFLHEHITEALCAEVFRDLRTTERERKVSVHRQNRQLRSHGQERFLRHSSREREPTAANTHALRATLCGTVWRAPAGGTTSCRLGAPARVTAARCYRHSRGVSHAACERVATRGGPDSIHEVCQGSSRSRRAEWNGRSAWQERGGGARFAVRT